MDVSVPYVRWKREVKDGKSTHECFFSEYQRYQRRKKKILMLNLCWFPWICVILIVSSGAQLDGVFWMYLIRYCQHDKHSMLVFQVTYDIDSSEDVKKERYAQTSFAFSQVARHQNQDPMESTPQKTGATGGRIARRRAQMI